MDLSKSLEELHKEKWGRPDFGSSLAAECRRLWSVPLAELSVENLRILIGQKIGLRFLVPVALDILAVNPLAEGDMYKGDLLANIAVVPDNFWQQYPEFNNQLVEIKSELEIIMGTITEELIPPLSSRVYQ
ncbi:contact-dependent growth inhibition system immunity protein [Microbulbifer sp. CNSA002]|uniref:contact-dependent growth inhibition system immunity protein n=1 Tax=unclassified Microbulbifer TaxID=2619833 RepID=UPI0039B380F0